jgi:hypothetical protein
MKKRLPTNIVLFVVACFLAGCAIFGGQKVQPVAFVLGKAVTLRDISSIEEDFKEGRIGWESHFSFWFPFWRRLGMHDHIVRPLMEKYAKEKGFIAEKDEIQVMVRHGQDYYKAEEERYALHRKSISKGLDVPGITEEKQEEIRSQLSEYDAACKMLLACLGPIPSKDYDAETRFVLSLKTDKALFQQHGGRVLHYIPEHDMLGGQRAIPLDAHYAFLRDAEKRGWLQFRDAELEAEFWSYYTNNVNGVFYRDDIAAKIMLTLPWAPDYDFKQMKRLVEQEPDGEGLKTAP